MRTLPQTLRDALATGCTTLCRCWTIVRTDGVVMGFTDHDRSLSFDGITFETSSGFNAAAIESATGLSVDTHTVTGALESADRLRILNGANLAALEYAPGSYEFRREITKPVAGSVRAAVDGVEMAEGPGFSVDGTTGIVTFATAPAAGTAVTAGFEFDVPVRFDTDVIEVNVAAFEAGEIPSIPAVEVRI